MTIYDISVEINSALPLWPGDPKLIIERFHKIGQDSSANVSRIEMGLHTGTHVDAPHHFLENGATLDMVGLDRFIGQVSVIEIDPQVNLITEDVIADLPDTLISERVLFKTRNSGFWSESPLVFHRDFVAIDLGGAQALVGRGVKLVGIDYLSIAPIGEGEATHKALLGAGIVIIEGLDLSAVNPGSYLMYCLPLKLGGVEGAPARVILVGN